MSPTKPINCLIIDDEAPARRVIQKYLEDVPGVTVAAECRNAFEALEALHEHHPDLIFLDINMPKLSGLDFLRTLSRPPLVIITTAYREHAIDGFDLDVVDYLHKPFALDRFLKALQKARARLAPQPAETIVKPAEPAKTEDQFIFVKEDKKVVRVDLKDILYLESVGDYVRVVTGRKALVTYMSLKKMADLLSPLLFPRIHKSYIVNIAHIDSIADNRVRVREDSLPIGASYRAGFMKLVDRFMAGKA
ncbi:MAG: LytTR family DNA-binding domain-containing protein [Candidatus Neomarinimicrobiota bacterium]